VIEDLPGGTSQPVPPWSSYRVQLHAGFGFRAAAGVACYLAELGVTHLYCSPYLQAADGSTHGYDVVDPGRFNDELGGAAGHTEMVGALRTAGLGQLLDIVPNHMATAPGNRWWWDVLENGPASLYARFFDIDWEGSDDKSAFTVLVPVLGDHYGRVLEAGELQLARTGGDFLVRYFDHELPISPRTLEGVLAPAARRAGSAELATVAEGFGSLPSARMTDTPAVMERHDHKLTLSSDLDLLTRADEAVAAAVDAEVAAINADPDRLDALLRRQNYRLAYWKTASDELDYRRFFNIETLIGVRIEDGTVFDETHRLILELVADGTVDGLRIDHVDGLRDPEGYLAELGQRTDNVYTVVEKILESDESLPETWPVSGTSGYDFLIRVNGLFVAAHNEQAMTDCYHGFTGETGDYGDVVQAAKQQIMGQELSSELQRLTGLVAELSDQHRRHRDHTRRELSDALRQLVARFPVYRTYVHPGRPTSTSDRQHVAEAVKATIDNRPDLDEELISFLGELALGDHPGDLEAEFVQRFQQFTAPVMAKGVEDTAFYRYHRLLSLNEVGGDPGVFGHSRAEFHAATADTAARWPRSMLTLSTHDTKRSADVRARLNVLSEIPVPWSGALQRWADANDAHRQDGWLDRNAEYLIYQTLVGAWPIDAERMTAFMAKATKEAKVRTSWTDPVADYDAGVEAFVRSILADRRFVEDLEQWLSEHRIVERGRRNSLAQTALLLTCPGVPDIYQGSEIWDLSLVDPDNRRAVDYEARRQLLRDLKGAGGDLPGSEDMGASKLRLIHRLLGHRRAKPEVYMSGDYEPLRFGGRRADEAVGYQRRALAVVIPRLGSDAWADTTVELPAGQWTDVITGSSVDGRRRTLAQVLGSFPVGVLVRDNA
jgi:(1->4)-alpha-D-glucan 1-alpha-D-glucosylmutase